MPISGEIKTGDRVTYEDMANPRRVGTVTTQDKDEYRVEWAERGETWLDPGYAWSTLRQYGWNRV